MSHLSRVSNSQTMECSHCYVDYFLPLQSLYYLRLPDVGIRAMTQSKVVPLSPEKKI